MPKNIVQMNNKYIKDESQRKRFLEEERKKRNRFRRARFDIGHVTVYSSNL